MALKKRLRVRRERNQRGAALLELALIIPIFFILIALVLDIGLGYTDSRSSSSTARSAARIGALAGEDRLADFRVLDAIRAQYGDGDDVEYIVIYRTDKGGNGIPSAGCLAGATGNDCNKYDGSILNGLSKSAFASVGNPEVCAPGSIDSDWCPTDRRSDAGSYLGVAIATKNEAAVGLVGADEYRFEDRAVFALYFAPLPTSN